MYNDSIVQVSYLIIYTYMHVCVPIYKYVYISHIPVKYVSLCFKNLQRDLADKES